MVLNFNVQGDFETVLDGWEPVTLLRRGGSEEIALPRAWRYSGRSEPAEPGVADVARHDVEWQFAWNDEVDKPRIGDAIVDAADEAWTILSVIEHGAKSRLRCVARNLAFVHALADRVEILVAVWEDGGSGPEIVGWNTLYSAVPASIQPERTTVDHATDPPTSVASYRVILGRQLALDHNHRIVDGEGTTYRVLEFTQAERIDALPVAKVKKLPAAP
jgi:hypothetical protein